MLKESRPKFLFSIFWSQNRVGAQLSKFLLQFAAFGLFLSPTQRVSPYLPPTNLQKSSAAALYMVYIDIKGILLFGSFLEEVEKMHPAVWLPKRRIMVRFCSNLASEQV